MRLHSHILSLGVVAVLVGCRSPQPISSDDSMQRLAAARVAEVPLPATTPFDSESAARAAYLDAYKDGYRSGLVSLNVLFQAPDEKDVIRTRGWFDGARAGMNTVIASKRPK